MNELCHFGIKGMRWGVRRFQNKDGTLTAAGRKRASKAYKKKRTKLLRSLIVSLKADISTHTTKRRIT